MDNTHTQRLEALIQHAQALADQITDQTERDRASFNAGYREAAAIFFHHGVDVGYTQAENELADRFADLQSTIHTLATIPTHNELTDRRNEPGNLWRYARGDTNEPDHYTAAFLRRGGEYTGGPVPWTTEDTTQEPTPNSTPQAAA